MDEKDNEAEANKTDWALIDSARRTSKRAEPYTQGRPAELVATVIPSAATQELAVPLPAAGAARGILMKWKSSTMERKATVTALDAQYSSALEILKHRLQKTVQGQNARADVDFEAYIKKLDQEYLEVWAELGLRNKDVRERTLIQLTETTAAKLKEVQAADWPKELKDEAINELFALRKRFAAEMMKELGSDT